MKESQKPYSQEVLLAFWLTGLSLLLGIYILFFAPPLEKEEKLPSFRRVPVEETDSIQVIEIEREKTKLRLFRIAPYRWKVRDELSKQEDVADGLLVGELLQALRGITYEEVRKAKKVSLKALQLSPPRLKLVLHYGVEREVLSFGKKVKGKKLVFLLFRNKIFLVPLHFRSIWEKSFEELRERKLLSLSFYDVDRFVLQTPQWVWSFRKEKGEWFLWYYPWGKELPKGKEVEEVLFYDLFFYQILHLGRKASSFSPLAQFVRTWVKQWGWKIPLSRNKVRSFFEKLASLEILQFHPLRLDTLSRFGLSFSQPSAKLLFFQGGELGQRIFFWFQKKKVFASLEADQRQFLVELPKKAEELFSLSFSLLFSKTPFLRDEEECQRLDVQGIEHWSLKKKGTKWEFSPPLDVVDQKKVNQALQGFFQLLAEPLRPMFFSVEALPDQWSPQWFSQVKLSLSLPLFGKKFRFFFSHSPKQWEFIYLPPHFLYSLPHKMVFLISRFPWAESLLEFRHEKLYPHLDRLKEVEIFWRGKKFFFSKKAGLFESPKVQEWVEGLCALPVLAKRGERGQEKGRLVFRTEEGELAYYIEGNRLFWEEGRLLLEVKGLESYLKGLWEIYPRGQKKVK